MLLANRLTKKHKVIEILKIGEFAQEAKVSIKTLRYYDSCSLLKPAWKDRFSGYRYYHRSQLGELKRILALKDLGFSLEQIQTILQEDITLNQLRAMLILKRSELQTEIQSHQDRLEQIEVQLKKLEKNTDEGEGIAEVLFPVEHIPVSLPNLTDKEFPTMDVKIKTALVSVSDKEGVVEFAGMLSEMGVKIISTGGTARKIKEAGIDVVSVDSVTGFPEMMDGRVKTLHP